MTSQAQGRGRPRMETFPLTSTERARRRRERLKAQGATSHVVNLSPEVMHGLEEWARLIDQQKTVDDMVEVTVGIGIHKLLEPGKQELLAAFADPNNKPVGRLLALLGALGAQAMQDQINREILAKA